MHYDRTVIAYHGCDLEVAERLMGGEAFRPSKNDYDWLGTGAYFWEFGPDRALRWAEEEAGRSGGKIKKPAVVGALIQLGNCFDLMDTRFTGELRVGYQKFAASMEQLGKRLPSNDRPSSNFRERPLDCAVINFYLELVKGAEGITFDTVRCCFTEGAPAFAGSKIQELSHIQIAVRTLACIVGVFRPTL